VEFEQLPFAIRALSSIQTVSVGGEAGLLSSRSVMGCLMERKMGLRKIAFLCAPFVFGILCVAAIPGNASAYVICNNEGDCWHSERVEHVPGMNFETHPDDWYFHQEWGRYRRFHEYRDGRGYWHNGVWVEL
jgi:hypothetical protein